MKRLIFTLWILLSLVTFAEDADFDSGWKAVNGSLQYRLYGYAMKPPYPDVFELHYRTIDGSEHVVRPHFRIDEDELRSLSDRTVSTVSNTTVVWTYQSPVKGVPSVQTESIELDTNFLIADSETAKLTATVTDSVTIEWTLENTSEKGLRFELTSLDYDGRAIKPSFEVIRGSKRQSNRGFVVLLEPEGYLRGSLRMSDRDQIPNPDLLVLQTEDFNESANAAEEEAEISETIDSAFAEPPLTKHSPPAPGLESATLGAGPFWSAEAMFQGLKGVHSVESGYSGGNVANPTFEDVTEKAIGHVEVVRIHYDPNVISYKEILEVFFQMHDPTTLDRQGNDVGRHFRSVIFTHGPEQEQTAKEVRGLAQNWWPNPIVTEIKGFQNFYAAEDAHQDYYATNANKPYCKMVIAPKLERFQQKFAELIK